MRVRSRRCLVVLFALGRHERRYTARWKETNRYYLLPLNQKKIGIRAQYFGPIVNMEELGNAYVGM